MYIYVCIIVDLCIKRPKYGFGDVNAASMVHALLKHVVYCTSFATVFADDHDLMELAYLISLISTPKT